MKKGVRFDPEILYIQRYIEPEPLFPPCMRKKVRQPVNNKPDQKRKTPAEMKGRKLSWGDLKGVGGIFIWFLIVILIFCLIYFLF